MKKYLIFWTDTFSVVMGEFFEGVDDVLAIKTDQHMSEDIGRERHHRDGKGHLFDIDGWIDLFVPLKLR